MFFLEMVDLSTWEKTLNILLEQGVLGAMCVILLFLYIKERRESTIMAKSFNRQLKEVNEKRAVEVRQTAEALQAASDSNHMLAHTIERLHDFLIKESLGGD
jgi:hypothetical protein